MTAQRVYLTGFDLTVELPQGMKICGTSLSINVLKFI